MLCHLVPFNIYIYIMYIIDFAIDMFISNCLKPDIFWFPTWRSRSWAFRWSVTSPWRCSARWCSLWASAKRCSNAATCHETTHEIDMNRYYIYMYIDIYTVCSFMLLCMYLLILCFDVFVYLVFVYLVLYVIRLLMWLLLYVCVYVCMRVCVCVSVCVSVCMYVCTSVCLSVFLSVCMSVCLYVCLSLCLCTYVRTYVWGGLGRFCMYVD